MTTWCFIFQEQKGCSCILRKKKQQTDTQAHTCTLLSLLVKQPAGLKESASASTSINNHWVPTRIHQKHTNQKQLMVQTSLIALKSSLKVSTCATCQLTSSAELTSHGYSRQSALRLTRQMKNQSSTALHNAWRCFTN